MIPTNHSILLFHIHFVLAFRFPESTLHPPLWGSSHLLQPHLCLWRDVEQLRAMTPSVSLSNNRMEWILFIIHQDERLTEDILYVELESRTCSHGVLRKCCITASMLLQRILTQQHGEIYCPESLCMEECEGALVFEKRRINAAKIRQTGIAWGNSWRGLAIVGAQRYDKWNFENGKLLLKKVDRYIWHYHYLIICFFDI